MYVCTSAMTHVFADGSSSQTCTANAKLRAFCAVCMYIQKCTQPKSVNNGPVSVNIALVIVAAVAEATEAQRNSRMENRTEKEAQIRR